MAKFNSKSRYVSYSSGYRTVDQHGNETIAVAPARLPKARILGDHLLKDHERLDHLSNYYLNNPSGYWAIANANDLIVPDTAYAFHAIRIPEGQ